MTVVEAGQKLLERVDRCGTGVSMRWSHREVGVEPDIQDGEVMGITLIPAAFTVEVSFDRRQPPHVRVSLRAEGPTAEACCAVAVDTLDSQAGLLGGAKPC